MKQERKQTFDPKAFLAEGGCRRTLARCHKNKDIFSRTQEASPGELRAAMSMARLCPTRANDDRPTVFWPDLRVVPPRRL
jgi:hypothetical protein